MWRILILGLPAIAGLGCGEAPPVATPGRANACTPGIDQTCNDDPAVSSLWGRCTAEGACACAAGRVINPATGRCTLSQ